MLDTFGFPTPQGANYQEFYGGGTVRDWVKPRGASMVRMLLIGAGAGGGGSTTATGGAGSGSAAVTQWIGPAIFVPDILRVSIGAGSAGAIGSATVVAGGNTTIVYQSKDGTGYTLLTAEGSTATFGAASTNNYFGAAGIFKSINGQDGASPGGNITAPTTTFLSGGAGGGNTTGDTGGLVNCNYGYPQIPGGTGGTGGNGNSGYFLNAPIMIGIGGSGGGGSNTASGGIGGRGGIGCGGGGAGRCTSGTSTGGRGGDGAAFIWSW
jgi:hypothetical protein